LQIADWDVGLWTASAVASIADLSTALALSQHPRNDQVADFIIAQIKPLDLLKVLLANFDLKFDTLVEAPFPGWHWHRPGRSSMKRCAPATLGLDMGLGGLDKLRPQ
jgi:hypothetical protein